VDRIWLDRKATSMATPHVAGSAAILAERHPNWKAFQLKAALMGTAKDDGYSVYEQGAGRVDIGRADTQNVFATTAALDYESQDAGQTPAAKQIGYANLGDTPVTLTLSASLKSADGKTVSGALTTDKSIVVPAGGTAAANVGLAAADGTSTGTLPAPCAPPRRWAWCGNLPGPRLRTPRTAPPIPGGGGLRD
jgi:subtilisin family serine protease